MRESSFTKSVLLPGVLIETITPPFLIGFHLPRARLLEFFELAPPRVLVVMAPTGFGKTVLGAQWAMQHPDSTVWFNGTSSDTGSMMLHRMICAVRRILPDFADWYEVAPNVEARITQTIERMCSDLAVIGKPIDFIYDNMEVVPTINTPFIQTWARALPDNTRRLSLRKNPPLVSYSSQGDELAVKYLTANDLTLTNVEISQLADSLGIDISETSTKNFLAKLQGWPTGITLLFDLLSHQNNLVLNNMDFRNYNPKLPREVAEQLSESRSMSDQQLDEIITRMIDKVFYGPRSRGGKAESLTAREAEILLKLDSNVTLEVIATKLFISKNTLKTHLKNLYRKLDADSRDSAVAKARNLSLI